MAAYAALVNVMHIIEQIQLHPSPPISLHQKQVQSLTETITFLQDFLEVYPHDGSQEAYDLEGRIRDAAHAAEDVIESHIVDRIRGGSTSSHGENSNDLYQDLGQVIKDMDFNKKEVVEIKAKKEIQDDKLPPQYSILPVGSSRTSSPASENIMVGLDDILIEIMERLTGQQSKRLIIPIVGMGGIGKTTLARNVYAKPIIKESFDICAWATISQDYNAREILLEILLSSTKNESSRESLRGMSEEELEGCPRKLEEIGKKIAKTCKGLPLSIAVIGGLLAKSERTPQHWKYIAENLNLIVNLEDDARCLKILSMSYFNLPVYLKPCFLYMGVFNEDMDISISLVVRLWVAEGFLKPISGKCLEEVAEDYLKHLIDRNLISVHRRGSSGKIKSCKIHDLLRDLCLREAQKEKFIYAPRVHSPSMLQSMNTERCIVLNSSTWSHHDEYTRQLLPFGLQLPSVVRSLIYNFKEGYLPSRTSRLLRVLEAACLECFVEDIFQFVNLRSLALSYTSNLNTKFPSSMCLLWNLQTLVINKLVFNKCRRKPAFALSEIWMMPHLRHVELRRFYILDPPSDEKDKPVFVLRNLHTLLEVLNFKCGEDVVKRIPNIKKLRLFYNRLDEGLREYRLNNLGSLHKLESLSCVFDFSGMPTLSYLVQNLTFPHSLKKLTLMGIFLDWEEMSSKVGSLPLLQVLKLKDNSCKGPEWKPVEGQFCSLRYLLIDNCDDLEYWTADNINFPLLEQLVLRHLGKLKEVPLGIGDIPTLRSIELHACRDSVIISAKEIADQQDEFGNMDLQVHEFIAVKYWNGERYKFLKSLKGRDFQVESRHDISDDPNSW
ncbi:hypothetical protein BUALT_BualtUnG0018400 [Buddleja alternifolia]|uniref:Disease resistance protein n=1 Tax=Buddleja alternifolia TaxID=168488 RepID=A0AAV6W1D0_9LAMI|nr:hypothetical protein BUALT_BualtUnG0018400 [Buddleja alternifolia]